MIYLDSEKALTMEKKTFGFSLLGTEQVTAERGITEGT